MHSQIDIGWRDVEGLDQFAFAIRRIGSQQAFGDVARRALNRTGDMARTQVVRSLAKQTGLIQRIIKRAAKPIRANYSNYAYRIRATGGDISLKYFKPRETRRGVSAKPFGKRKVFAGTFMRGGLFPNRVPVGVFHGHVFARAGADRLPIEKVKSGVIIPAEMVEGESVAAFERSVGQNLPRRFRHELNRLTGGAFS